MRAIGRWTLAALVLNSIIGSGIFGIPSDVARLVGGAGPIAYLIAAAGIGLIMGCFAEVGSQFGAAGGPYLYARVAYGRFMGLQMGWLALLVRLTSAAANANLFVVYLGQFYPAATTPLPRAALLTALLGLLLVINLRGVRGGARLSNLFMAAKLLPLALFIFAGLALAGIQIPAPRADAGLGAWLTALLALVFAYGGFEAALIPMAEVQRPRRDTPFALFVALASCALLYTAVHVVVMSALPDPASSPRPVADAARVFLGAGGAALIAIGAMISMAGYLSGQFVSAPRLPYALAQEGDFPAPFGAVHRRFRTPHIAILVYGLTVWALALYGSFIWNAILSAVARLFTYALVCGALLILRRRRPQADAYRLPAGPLVSVLGIAFSAALVATMGAQELAIVAATVLVALANWLWVRRRAARSAA